MKEQILELRAQGLGYLKIAKQLGVTKDHVRHVCKQNNVAGFIAGDPTFPKSDERVAEFIAERIPGFEYAGNYTGCDGTADIRCVVCGTVTTRSMVTIRHRNVKCRTCEAAEKEKRKLAWRESPEDKRRKRFFDYRDFEQTTMKQCPVCRAFFFGGRKYCSKKCQEQNKWHMKEGYRNLFPLQEVYDRDGGRCYLCGGMCDWNDFFVKDGTIIYGNNYPSRDHVIPKSRGGKNEWNNIRLAHRRCNSLKKDSPLVKN